VRQVIHERYTHLSDHTDRITAAAEENVLFGIENLRTYPCVHDRVEAGTLRLHAWFYKIATGELFAYDPEVRQFAPLVKPA
jgi:carbonic anhydrase